MQDKKKKDKRIIPLRQAGETVEKPENRPSKRLFDEVKRESERLAGTDPTALSAETPSPLLPPPPTTTPYQSIIEQPVSPSSNYFKTSNDEVDEAIRLGLFKGTSYETYKVLFRQTRGHVSQRRNIKLTFSEIEKLAGVSHNTLRGHLKWLEGSFWIHRNYKLGDNSGVEIEVRTYSEIKHLLPPPPTTPSYHPLPGTTTPQNVGGGTTQNLGGGGRGFDHINIDSNETLRLSFKTLSFKIDDEAPILDILEKLNVMAQKITGKNLTEKDLEKLPDAIDILISETLLAAARAETVSSVIPFLTENLRRRLYSMPRRAERKITARKHLNVGKGSEIKNDDKEVLKTLMTPLTPVQRENTLEALKEAKAAGNTIFQEFKAYGEIEYITEDFEWLMENLEKKN